VIGLGRCAAGDGDSRGRPARRGGARDAASRAFSALRPGCPHRSLRRATPSPERSHHDEGLAPRAHRRGDRASRGLWAPLERSRHGWPHPARVQQTVLDANVLGPGSTWELRAVSRDSGGSQVEMVLAGASAAAQAAGSPASSTTLAAGAGGTHTFAARSPRSRNSQRPRRPSSITDGPEQLPRCRDAGLALASRLSRGARASTVICALAPGRISTASRVTRPIPRRCPVKAHASVSAGPLRTTRRRSTLLGGPARPA
jgi:hypothetical protein